MSESALDPANYKYNGGPQLAGTTIEGDVRYTFEITQNVRTNDGQFITGNAFDQDFDEVGPVNESVTVLFVDNVASTLVSAQYVVPAADSETADRILLTLIDGL